MVRYLIMLLALCSLAQAQDYGTTISVKEYRDQRTFTDPYSRIQKSDAPIIISVDTSHQEPAITVHQDTTVSIGVHQYSNPYRTWVSEQGFRVQIYNGNREGASLAQFDFMELRTEEEVYIEFQQPNFKVRVGNFKTEAEAKTFIRDIREHFPGAYVVPSTIEIQR